MCLELEIKIAMFCYGRKMTSGLIQGRSKQRKLSQKK